MGRSVAKEEEVIIRMARTGQLLQLIKDAIDVQAALHETISAPYKMHHFNHMRAVFRRERKNVQTIIRLKCRQRMM
jgi:hypothetical protein